MQNKTYRGFTLLELLLVVAMIAMLLATVGFNMFAGLAKGRDSRRLQDIKDIQKALQLTFITDKAYPKYTTEIALDGSDALNALLLGRGDSMAAIKDPINDATYKYWYRSDASGITYQLRFCLETDQVRGFKKDCTNIITP